MLAAPRRALSRSQTPSLATTGGAPGRGKNDPTARRRKKGTVTSGPARTQGSRLRNPSAFRGARSSIAIDLPVNPQRAIATTTLATRPLRTVSSYETDPRLGPGSERNREHELSGGTSDRHAAASQAGAANEAGTTKQAFSSVDDSWTPALYVLRAYQDCRAGFAGRDTQVVVRTAGRSTLTSGSDLSGRCPSCFAAPCHRWTHLPGRDDVV